MHSERKELSGAQQLSIIIALAAERHAGQFDQSGRPYILHPLRVMGFLGPDEDYEVLCAAVGHDIIEDTKTTYKELRELGISERVVEAIRCLTKIPGETNEEYEEKVMSNIDAMKVKMCDLKHNSDITRLKSKDIKEKDILRTIRYHTFYVKIEAELKRKGTTFSIHA